MHGAMRSAMRQEHRNHNGFFFFLKKKNWDRRVISSLGDGVRVVSMERRVVA